jgi:2-polyprenyl-6-methoxyphenol hydroxylase-like FAD-dependent oxidoreductase
MCSTRTEVSDHRGAGIAVGALQGSRHFPENAGNLRYGWPCPPIPGSGEPRDIRSGSDSHQDACAYAVQPGETPYAFVAMVPQDVTEKLLVQELQRRGGHVEYQTSFISAIQHDHHVSATLENAGRRLEVTAKFVVGCDGAHSTVRHLLNLPFEGAEYNDMFLLADAQTNDVLPADQLQLCPSEFGPVAIFPNERHPPANCGNHRTCGWRRAVT